MAAPARLSRRTYRWYGGGAAARRLGAFATLTACVAVAVGARVASTPSAAPPCYSVHRRRVPRRPWRRRGVTVEVRKTADRPHRRGALHSPGSADRFPSVRRGGSSSLESLQQPRRRATSAARSTAGCSAPVPAVHWHPFRKGGCNVGKKQVRNAKLLLCNALCHSMNGSPGSPAAGRAARPVAQPARMGRVGRRASLRLSEASGSPRRGRGEGAQEAFADEPLQCSAAVARRCTRRP